METFETLQKALDARKEKWIQKAFRSVKKRGTSGKCTGSKFGSKSCPSGSKAYNMAKNMRKISKNKKKK